VGGGAPEPQGGGTGERGESGAQKGEWNENMKGKTLRARGGYSGASGLFSESLQLYKYTITDIFCRKNGKYCTIKYYVRKIQNPWIFGKHEIQYLIVVYFPFFGQKY
jgi:hypothetical protein